MNRDIIEIIENNPIIAAIKSDRDLKAICRLKEIEIVFVLYGDICNIRDIVATLQKSKKTVFVHADLVNGLSGREIIVDFIKDRAGADGIISTKTAVVKRAAELGLYTVLRFFVLDSLAYEGIEKNLSQIRPDCFEVMPGVMPKIIKKLSDSVKVPMIVGGLISDKEDVISALSAGALAVSTTNHNVWTCMAE